MAHDFTPSPAFHDQFRVDFETAYNWTQGEIIEFLKNVSEKPKDYKAPENFKDEFNQLYTHINSLRRPGGALYEQPTPAQQLLRTQDDLAPTEPMKWINDQKERFFIIHDLLGIFLSLMGAPTSGTLTATNYSLPLVALYGKWCGQLANGATAWTPATAQITWATSTDGKFYPFLGISAQGFNPGKSSSIWKTRTQKTRWSYLNGILQSPYDEFGKSPDIDKNGKGGTNFGNCGETYPFLYILADKKYVDRSYGIALSVRSTQGPYNGNVIWKNENGELMPPCINCKALLEWYGVKNPKNFEDFPIKPAE